MKTKRLLSALMMLALLCLLLFGAAVPAAAVSDLDSLQAALDAGGTVVLAADIEVPAGESILVLPGVTATLDLNGHKVGGGEFDQQDSLLLVEGDLTLVDSAGGGQLSAAYDCVYVYDGSFTMTGGVIEDVGMAGVVLAGEQPRCVIDGGVIAGCRGIADEETGAQVSGACIYAFTGTVEIRGGTLRDSSYGLFLLNGSAVMSGGEISGIHDVINPVDGGRNGGVGVVLMDGADFSMTGGLISGCEGFGIWLIDRCSAEMSGGEITGGLDGVCLYGDETVFTLTDGALHDFEGMVIDEEEYCYYGAGIDIYSGSAVMAGGEIYDAPYGIQIGSGNTGSAAMSGGTIRDLRFQWADDGSWYGGEGIVLGGGEFTMTGGTVRDVPGTGVRVTDGASAAVSGGSISKCGMGGISAEYGGTLILSGAPELRNDEEICLFGDSVIALGGPITNETPYRVWTDRLGKEETLRFTEELAGNGGAENFLCANRTWYAVETDETGEAVLSYHRYCDDVKVNDWYSEGVSYCLFYDMLEAADGRFDPNGTLKRADMAELLWGFIQKPEADPATELPFTDVPADAPYAEELRFLVEDEIIGDDGDGLFLPDEPVTREQFANMLYILTLDYGYGYEDDWDCELYFSDAEEISEAAVEAMCWMVDYGVLRGMGNGTLNPGGIVTRAQAATMLVRLVDVYTDLGMYEE